MFLKEELVVGMKKVRRGNKGIFTACRTVWYSDLQVSSRTRNLITGWERGECER